jgi:hypothetical protein
MVGSTSHITDTSTGKGGAAITPHASNAQPGVEGARALNIETSGTVTVEYGDGVGFLLWVAGGIAFPCGGITRISASTAATVNVIY